MQKVFVVYDSKSEAYGNPFVAQSTGVAIRSYADEVNRKDGQSQVAAHPEDFTLFEVGTYDEHTGLISMYEAKKSLGVGLDFKREVEPAMKLAK